MNLVTDLKVIERLGSRRWEENLEFRSYLKQLPMPEEEVDQIVHDIAAEVADAIDCDACRNCCISASPRFGPEERRAIAGNLGITLPELEKQYGLLSPTIDEIFGVGAAESAESPACPFFKDGNCIAGDAKPIDCKTYPHLNKADFQSRLFGIIGSYSICPIVFNVIEQLKKHFDWEYDEDSSIPF